MPWTWRTATPAERGCLVRRHVEFGCAMADLCDLFVVAPLGLAAIMAGDHLKPEHQEGNTTMRMIAGVCDAKQVSSSPSGAGNQLVEVFDGHGEVILDIGRCTYPAGLTPEQARHIAACLLASADRIAHVRAAEKPKEPPRPAPATKQPPAANPSQQAPEATATAIQGETLVAERPSAEPPAKPAAVLGRKDLAERREAASATANGITVRFDPINEVEVDGNVSKVSPRAARLAHALARAAPLQIGHDFLIKAIWPTQRPADPRDVLKYLAAELRAKLAPHLIVTDLSVGINIKRPGE